MKFIMLAYISCLLVACAAEKTTRVVVAPAVETANEVTPEEAPSVEPDGDPLGDVSWSPKDGQNLPVDSDRSVELGIEGAYQEDLEVNGQKKPEPDKVYRCTVPKDCYGMNHVKSPGEFRCINKECVYKVKNLNTRRGDGDVIEIF